MSLTTSAGRGAAGVGRGRPRRTSARDRRRREDRRAAHRLGRAVAADRGVRRRAGRAAARARRVARRARDGRAGAVDRGAGARDRARGRPVGRARGPHRRRAAPRRADADPDDPLLRRGDRDGAAVLAPRRAARGRPRRVPRAAADLDRGHDRARRGAEPRDRSSSASSCCRSRSTCCARPRCAAPRRWSRAEVPRRGLAGLGDAALRPGVPLRRDRLDGLRRDRQCARRRRRSRHRPAAADRHRADDRRPGLQVLGGAVSPVDARRLRGRADADHGVHGGRDEGGRVRRHAAPVRRRADRGVGRLGAAARRARGDHDRRRQRRRARPVLAEAAARLLVGRAGGLHARRRRRRLAARDCRRRSSTSPSTSS